MMSNTNLLPIGELTQAQRSKAAQQMLEAQLNFLYGQQVAQTAADSFAILSTKLDDIDVASDAFYFTPRAKFVPSLSLIEMALQSEAHLRSYSNVIFSDNDITELMVGIRNFKTGLYKEDNISISHSPLPDETEEQFLTKKRDRIEKHRAFAHRSCAMYLLDKSYLSKAIKKCHEVLSEEHISKVRSSIKKSLEKCNISIDKVISFYSKDFTQLNREDTIQLIGIVNAINDGYTNAKNYF